jgi:hypothetical protein
MLFCPLPPKGGLILCLVLAPQGGWGANPCPWWMGANPRAFVGREAKNIRLYN